MFADAFRRVILHVNDDPGSDRKSVLGERKCAELDKISLLYITWCLLIVIYLPQGARSLRNFRRLTLGLVDLSYVSRTCLP
jgi:hypothetical protein